MPNIPEEIAAATIAEVCRCIEALIHIEFNEPTGEPDWRPMNTHGFREVAQYLRDNRTTIIASVTKPGE